MVKRPRSVPGRRAAPAPAARRHRGRRWLIGSVLLIALAAIGIAVTATLRRPAAGGRAAPLNVLLVTLDTTRADHIGCYGNTRARTPTLDRLAAEGTRFEQAESPAPITFAAHCSVFTGLYPFEHGARGNGEFYLTDRVETLATRLGAIGYRTAAFVSSFVLDRRYGLARGFDTYDDRMDNAASWTKAIEIEAERRGDRTVAAFSTWLEAYAADRSAPFLAWLHLYDPHTPYTPPPPFAETFADSPYDGEIAFDDALLARVLDELGRLGLRDRTLVVVVGDHGESLGDHGEETHSMFVYESAIRVPFIVWRPGLVPAGHVVREPVRLTDVAPTILDLAGAPGLASRSGRSLVGAMRGQHPAPPPAYAETLAPQLNMNWAPLRSVREERWKLIDAPRPELYDLQRDPGERQNLAAERPQTLRALTDLLAGVAGNGQGALTRAPVDEATRSRLAALGYIGAGSGGRTPPAGDARDPKDFIDVYNRLNQASRAVRERRFAVALPIVREVLAKDARNAFAQQILGDAYLGLREYAKALDHYRTYGNLVPPTAYVHHLVAVCHLGLGQKSAALQEAQAALAIDPKFADAHILRGSVFEGRGQYEAAVTEFRAAAESDPARAMIRLDLAKALVEAGRPGEAERQYQGVLARQPDFLPALADLGGLYIRQGKLQDATSVLEKALALDPERAEARFNLALVLERQGRSAEAAQQWQRVVESGAAPADVRRAAAERLRALHAR